MTDMSNSYLEDISGYIERGMHLAESSEDSPKIIVDLLNCYLHDFKDEQSKFYTSTNCGPVSIPLWFQRNLESNILKVINIVRRKLGLNEFQLNGQLITKSEKIALYESTFNMEIDAQVNQAILSGSAPISSLHSIVHAISIIVEQLKDSDTCKILCSSEFKLAAVSAKGTYEKTTVVQIFE